MNSESVLRTLAQEGNAAVCVPSALKDAGIDVPQSLFWEAAIAGGMDFEKAARQLGYKVERPDIDLTIIYQQLADLQSEGTSAFITLGITTKRLGVIGQHINALLEAVRLNNNFAFKLGGIPPFGQDKGDIFELKTLQQLTPKNGLLLIHK